MFIESVMPFNHLILCPLLLLLPSIFHSLRGFSDESALPIRWPEYWSFSFSISPSNDYSGLISFRVDWFDLFAVQGTLNSLLQHHSVDVHQNLKIIALKFENHFFQQHFCAVWVSVFTHFSCTALYFTFLVFLRNNHSPKEISLVIILSNLLVSYSFSSG